MGQGLFYVFGYGCLEPEQFVPARVRGEARRVDWLYRVYQRAEAALPELGLETPYEAAPLFWVVPVAYSPNAVHCRYHSGGCAALDGRYVTACLKETPADWAADDRYAVALARTPPSVAALVGERQAAALAQWEQLRAFCAAEGVSLPEAVPILVNDWD